MRNQRKIGIKLFMKGQPKNTRNGTKTWINLLNKYIVLRCEGNSIDDIKDQDLPDLLEHFFSELKKPKGKNNEQNEPYKNSSMRVIRGGINRYLKEKRNIDIMSDDRFIRCKFLFQGVMKQNKAKGYGSIVHKNPICPEDLAKLQDYFSQYMAPNPTILQRFVQFNLMYFLCRRGRENLTGMKKETFAVSIDLVCIKTYFTLLKWTGWSI